MVRIVALGLTAGLLLSGCGETWQERGATGAGLGAAAGAATGAIAGDSAATGALIGGALGGAGGALTDEETIDLGDPVWEEF